MIPSEQVTRQTFNRLKIFYDRSWDPINHTLHVGLFLKKNDDLFQAYAQATEFLLSKLNAMRPITPASRLLDVGCGNGKTLIDVCAQFECSGTGIDISDAQIEQARRDLTAVNRARKADDLPLVKCKFVRGSASQLRNKVGRSKFTHVISQDALMLVTNKPQLFKDLRALVCPLGVIGIADFLSEVSQKDFSAEGRAKVFKFINWREGLSFEQYKDVLEQSGFSVQIAQRRSTDMKRTYQLLVKQLKKMKVSGKTYEELTARYQNIVKAVQSKKMGWGLFFAVKK